MIFLNKFLTLHMRFSVLSISAAVSVLGRWRPSNSSKSGKIKRSCFNATTSSLFPCCRCENCIYSDNSFFSPMAFYFSFLIFSRRNVSVNRPSSRCSPYSVKTVIETIMFILKPSADPRCRFKDAC